MIFYKKISKTKNHFFQMKAFKIWRPKLANSFLLKLLRFNFFLLEEEGNNDTFDFGRQISFNHHEANGIISCGDRRINLCTYIYDDCKYHYCLCIENGKKNMLYLFQRYNILI